VNSLSGKCFESDGSGFTCAAGRFGSLGQVFVEKIGKFMEDIGKS
jgi:hypothetical protein